jgi:hypothetical protein
MADTRIIHIAVPKQQDPDDLSDLDLRTRVGREEEVRRQVRHFGGFSVFWACENMRRAEAIGRVAESGEIQRLPSEFPWCAYSPPGEKG